MLKTKLVESKEFNLILQKAYMLNSRMRHLEFRLIDVDVEFNYIAGQFISLLFNKNSEVIRRNFSIANQPNKNNILEIAITYVPNGIASTVLHNIQIGEKIKTIGPFGTFILKPEEYSNIKRYVLVATGTGVTPFRAMLNSIENLINNKNLEFILLLGVRNREELLYATDFIDFSNKYSNFKFYPCYSRESEINDSNSNKNKIFVENFDAIKGSKKIYINTQEYYGYVQNQLIKLNLNPDNDLFYLCGNPNMIDEALMILKTLNVPSKHIKREKYISSK